MVIFGSGSQKYLNCLAQTVVRRRSPSKDGGAQGRQSKAYGRMCLLRTPTPTPKPQCRSSEIGLISPSQDLFPRSDRAA